MSLVIADISMSLDGFVTGPNAGLEHGLGIGGEPLHTWAMEPVEVDAEVLRGATEMSGAVIMGRNLFDIIDAPDGWNDEMGYGANLAATPPFVVVTHAPPRRPWVKAGPQPASPAGCVPPGTGGSARTVNRLDPRPEPR